MGFKKEKAVKELSIALDITINNYDLDPPTTESVVVVHVFKMPTAKQIERYHSEVVKIRRSKVKTFVANANWNLFVGTIMHVEGYDDLPSKDEQTLEVLEDYFRGDVVRLHVDGAVAALLEAISVEEAEWGKR